MSEQSSHKDSSHGFRRLFRLLSRPVRLTSRQGDVVIQPYRGYGYRDRAFFMGRVVKQPTLAAMERGDGVLDDLVYIVRRFLRRGIAGAEVIARPNGGEHRTTTDKDGYFRFNIRIPIDSGWQGEWRTVDLELPDPRYSDIGAQAPIYFPPETCRFVVISDIDDTVMYTGVANKAKMLWRLFATTAEDRVAFPGVAAFYRGLHQGGSGAEHNPMLYVSRAPWSIYEVIEEFFNIHKIPVGPVLFLRDWGMTAQHPLPKQSKGHKRALVEDMLAIYGDLPFVLIGDSGQRDPEIYSAVVRDNPSRVLAVYIRNVTHDSDRVNAIETLAKEVVEAGSSLVLAADSHAMGIHAADRGLISQDALRALRDEQLKGGEALSSGPHPVKSPMASAGQADKEAADRDELRETLKNSPDKEPPKSVVVE